MSTTTMSAASGASFARGRTRRNWPPTSRSRTSTSGQTFLTANCPPRRRFEWYIRSMARLGEIQEIR